VMYIIDVLIVCLLLLHIKWVAKKPETRLLHSDRWACKIIAFGFFLYPLTDRWRIPRMWGDNMFEIYGVDRVDDTEMTFGLITALVGALYFPLRSVHSWSIPAAGSLSYSLCTLMVGSPENHPYERSQYQQDCVCVIMLNFIFFIVWCCSMEREKYMRCQFLDIVTKSKN